MKKSIVFFLLITAIFYSCNNNEKKIKSEIPVAGEARFFAVVTEPDGSKRAAIVLRVIRKTIKTDSLKMVDKIIYDSVFGVARDVPVKDSTGKPIIDTATGKPKIITSWFVISRDSVNTKVQDIPLDSLLKK